MVQFPVREIACRSQKKTHHHHHQQQQQPETSIPLYEQTVCPFTCWRTSWLFVNLGCLRYKHVCAGFCVDLPDNFWYSAIQVQSDSSRLVDAVHFRHPWDIHFGSFFTFLTPVGLSAIISGWQVTSADVFSEAQLLLITKSLLSFLQVCYYRWMRFLGWLHRRLVSANETSREGAIPTSKCGNFVCSRHVILLSRSINLNGNQIKKISN